MVYVSARKLLEFFILFEEDVCIPLNSTLFSVEAMQEIQEVLPTLTEGLRLSSYRSEILGCMTSVANKVRKANSLLTE